MTIKKELYSAFLSGLALLGAVPALAQAVDSAQTAGRGYAIDEVIVTARKREEGLQSVPISVTAIDTEALREKSIENPYDLTTHVPGLVVRQGGATRGNVDYFIRGQGATFGSSSGVVTYFNEVPLKSQGYVGNNFQFYDMGSVQVLKGPQGTLFGRSSTGGAVLFSPIKPGDDLGGYLDVKAGNLDMMETSGALNIPIWEDKLAIRGAFNIQRRDGFTKSQSTGQKLDERSRESFRLGINFTPTDWLENYTLLQVNNVDESSTGAVLTDWNPDFPLLRTDLTIQPLMGFTPEDIGGFFAQPFVTGVDTVHQLCYGMALQGAVDLGDIPGCLATRTQRLVDLRDDLSIELDRVQGGGSIRKNLTARQNNQRGRNQQIINITTLNIGETGFLGDVTVKGILGLNRYRKSNLVREFGASRFPHGVVFNNNDLVGFPQRPVVDSRYEKSDFNDDVTTEIQMLGDVDGKHSWMLGYFRESDLPDFFGP
ncbi:MAG: TonB-dependent receptor, partial [Porticoccaceae bacterium]